MSPSSFSIKLGATVSEIQGKPIVNAELDPGFSAYSYENAVTMRQFLS
jgi:hypothetical protein